MADDTVMGNGRPPGAWCPPHGIIGTIQEAKILRLLLKNGTTKRIHPGTFQLINGVDVQFDADDNGMTVTRQIPVTSMAGVEL